MTGTVSPTDCVKILLTWYRADNLVFQVGDTNLLLQRSSQINFVVSIIKMLRSKARSFNPPPPCQERHVMLITLKGYIYIYARTAQRPVKEKSREMR